MKTPILLLATLCAIASMIVWGGVALATLANSAIAAEVLSFVLAMLAGNAAEKYV